MAFQRDVVWEEYENDKVACNTLLKRWHMCDDVRIEKTNMTVAAATPSSSVSNHVWCDVR